MQCHFAAYKRWGSVHSLLATYMQLLCCAVHTLQNVGKAAGRWAHECLHRCHLTQWLQGYLFPEEGKCFLHRKDIEDPAARRLLELRGASR